MPPRRGHPVQIGVTLRPERSLAVTLRDGSVSCVQPLPAAPPDSRVTVEAVVAAAGDEALDTVTVDLSKLMLDAIVRGYPELPPVAVIRIVPRQASDPMLAKSPSTIVERLVARRFTVAGGHDLLKHELCPLDREGLGAVCAELANSRIEHVAIVAAGSQACPDHERDVADRVQASVPGIRISAASDFGGQGLVAREATVILDAAVVTLTERLLDAWESRLSQTAGGAVLRISRGDGGYSLPSHIRELPIMAFGASDALELTGAAHLHGLPDCRVLMPRPGGRVAGEVRRGLSDVRPADIPDIGTPLVIPTAALAPDSGQRDASRQVTDVPVVIADRPPEQLACIGAAISRPTAWLDEVAYVESAADLERVCRDAKVRATAILMANGAAPGSADITEVSMVAVVAVPYSAYGTIRIRVRLAGASQPHRAAVAARTTHHPRHSHHAAAGRLTGPVLADPPATTR
jgi:hypothetical protein